MAKAKCLVRMWRVKRRGVVGRFFERVFHRKPQFESVVLYLYKPLLEEKPFKPVRTIVRRGIASA